MAKGKVRCGFCMEIFSAADFQITQAEESALAERAAARVAATESQAGNQQEELARRLALAEQAREQDQRQQEQERINQERLKQEQEEKALQQQEQERLERKQRDEELRQKKREERRRLEQEQLEKDRLEQEQLAREKLAQERLEQEKLEREQQEQQRLEQERLEQERLEQERLEQEKLEQERLEREQQEQERLAQEELERERLEREHREHERQKQERLEQEKLDQQAREKELTEAREQLERARQIDNRQQQLEVSEIYTEMLESGLSGGSLDDDLSMYQLDEDLEKLDQQLASAEQQMAAKPDDQWAEKLLAELDDDPPAPRQAAAAASLLAQSEHRDAVDDAAELEPTEEFKEYIAAHAEADNVARPQQGPESVAEEALKSEPETHSAEEIEPAPEPRAFFDSADLARPETAPELDSSMLPELMGDYDPIAAATDIAAPEPPQAADWRLPAAIVVLLLLLFAQYLIFNWKALSQSPSTRPALSSFCSMAGCDLPVYRDMKSLSTDQLNIGAHPTVEQALMVDAIITNNGAIEQPFPVLQLTFYNLRRKAVATRKFFPREYLDGELRGLSDMPSGNPVRIALEVFDPGNTAVNYELKLLPSL